MTVASQVNVSGFKIF